MLTKPRLTDVAEKAGVSMASVSRAINGSGSEEIRAKVAKAVEELGYIRHRAPFKRVLVAELNAQAVEITKLKAKNKELEIEIKRLRNYVKILGGQA